MDIEIKEVGLGDYESVIAIRDDVYESLDYLPALFHDVLKLPHHKGYAAVKDGTMVAFLVVGVLDDGSTLVTRAGRTRKEYEGQGVYKALNQSVLKRYKEKGSTVVLQTFGDGNKLMIEKLKRGESSLLIIRDLVEFHADGAKLDIPRLKFDQNTKTKILRPEDLTNLFRCKLRSKQLFPEGRIVSNWLPFKLLESNIPMINLNATLILGTFDHEAALLTAGFSYPCKRGYIGHVNVYGNDFSALGDHMTQQMNHCVERAAGKELCVMVNCTEAAVCPTRKIMVILGFNEAHSPLFQKFLCTETYL